MNVIRLDQLQSGLAPPVPFAEHEIHAMHNKTQTLDTNWIAFGAGGIFRARKVLEEELRSRAENGEETNFLAPSALASRGFVWRLRHRNSRAKTIPPAKQATNWVTIPTVSALTLQR